MSLTLSGIVERVTFHNAESGFSVFKADVKGERELIVIVGSASSIHAGEYVTCQGTWHHNRDFGRQFKADVIETTQPTTEAGIERYLASGMIKGIGPVYAKKLVEMFSTDIFDIIENHPKRLNEVEGIGKVRCNKITQGWLQQKHVRKIMLFLHGHGVTTLRALRIYKTYGEQAIDVINQNPYQLARDVRGIGFMSADRIALNVGIAKDAPQRLLAGLHHALMTAMDDGNCGLPQTELFKQAVELLQVPGVDLDDTLFQAVAQQMVIIDDDIIYLSHLYHQERAIAAKLRQLKEGGCPWPQFDTTKAIAWVETQTQLQLAPSQQQVLASVLTNKLSIITGGPGVGKTTLMKCLLQILHKKLEHILLCAPTGRAARRLTQSTGFDATTIHRMLEPDASMTQFKMNAENPLEVELLIVDESSMVDVPLMAALLKAVPMTAAVIFIGDVDQLPSVGPGQVLADMISSHKIPTFTLTEIFRQAATSTIIHNAHAINQGHMPVLDNAEGTDFFFTACETPEEGVDKIVQIVKERLPARFNVHPVHDIQVLSPMARGRIGARALNLALQEALNPSPVCQITL